MEEPSGAVKHESDRSSDEKPPPKHEDQIESPVNPLVADLPPDPDAHLSAQERAAIVSVQDPVVLLRD
jgi:hypothetical protein